MIIEKVNFTIGKGLRMKYFGERSLGNNRTTNTGSEIK